MPNCLPQLVHVVPANVHAVEENLAALNFVEPQQELDQRRFSGAGVADDGERLSRRDVERNVAQTQSSSLGFAPP